MLICLNIQFSEINHKHATVPGTESAVNLFYEINLTTASAFMLSWTSFIFCNIFYKWTQILQQMHAVKLFHSLLSEYTVEKQRLSSHGKQVR